MTVRGSIWSTGLKVGFTVGSKTTTSVFFGGAINGRPGLVGSLGFGKPRVNINNHEKHFKSGHKSASRLGFV